MKHASLCLTLTVLWSLCGCAHRQQQETPLVTQSAPSPASAEAAARCAERLTEQARAGQQRVLAMDPSEPEGFVSLAPLSDADRAALRTCAEALPESPEWFLVASGDALMPGGVLSQAVDLYNSALTGGGYLPPRPMTAIYDTLAYRSGETAQPVYVDPIAPIEAVLPSPSGAYFALAFRGRSFSMGGTYPRAQPTGPTVTFLDTRTLVPTSVALGPTETPPHSILLEWEEEGEEALWAWMRWADDDKPAVLKRCAAPAFTCTSQPLEAHVPVLPYVEVRPVEGGTWVEPIPEGLSPLEWVDRRTLRFSPDGQRYTWTMLRVHDLERRIYDRILLLHENGDDTVIASGMSRFEVRWLDDDRFLYDAVPTATERWTELVGDPEPLSEEAITELRAGLIDLSRIDELPAPKQAFARAIYAMDLEAAKRKATASERLGAELEGVAPFMKEGLPKDLQHEQVRLYDVKLGTSQPYLEAETHLRLFGQPHRPYLLDRVPGAIPVFEPPAPEASPAHEGSEGG